MIVKSYVASKLKLNFHYNYFFLTYNIIFQSLKFKISQTINNPIIVEKKDNLKPKTRNIPPVKQRIGTQILPVLLYPENEWHLVKESKVLSVDMHGLQTLCLLVLHRNQFCQKNQKNDTCGFFL